jgi:hypothetical protein
MARIFQAVRLLVPAALAAVMLGACAPVPDAAGPDEADGGDQSVLADGDHLGYLRLIDLDQGVILLDPVVWVNDEAEPNGFRIRDAADEVRQGRLGADVTASVIDCSQACEPRDVDLGAIAGGAARPFNGEFALFDVAVRDGEVTSVEERYTP